MPPVAEPQLEAAALVASATINALVAGIFTRARRQQMQGEFGDWSHGAACGGATSGMIAVVFLRVTHVTLALRGCFAEALRGHCVLAATKAAKLQLDPS